MRAQATAVNEIDRAMGRAPGAPRVLLAISGGRDSMVLLDAAARARVLNGATPQLIVATFDHGTGSAAREATALVARQSRGLGLPCVIGRSGSALTGEAEWRRARWTFLRRVAARETATIATAHTRDDQIETVLIRGLRGAGARGLAGLYARSDVIRPLVDVPRKTVAEYAVARSVRFVEDPTNQSRAFLRNRVRLDLIPALERSRPGFGTELLALARRAAVWRDEVETAVDSLGIELLDAATLRIAAAALDGYDSAALGVLWPAIAARAGIAMDRRGTLRAATFTMQGKGRVMQASGGVQIERVGDAFVVRREAR